MDIDLPRPARLRRFVAPPLVPVPAVTVAVIAFQLYLYFSSQSPALLVKNRVESFMGAGFVEASVRLLIGAVSIHYLGFALS
jgi:hypothetical protein